MAVHTLHVVDLGELASCNPGGQAVLGGLRSPGILHDYDALPRPSKLQVDARQSNQAFKLKRVDMWGGCCDS